MVLVSLASSESSPFISNFIHECGLRCLFSQERGNLYLPVFPALKVALKNARAPCSAHPTDYVSLLWLRRKHYALTRFSIGSDVHEVMVICRVRALSRLVMKVRMEGDAVR